MEREQDYYQILGIDRDALHEEIRSAYFLRAKKFHPDANPDPYAKEGFFIVKQAYETLIDPEKRAVYDLTLKPLQIGDTIKLDIVFSQKTLKPLEENQLIYVMLGMTNPPNADSSQIIPIHICLVIDVSTSMKGERLDMIKSSALTLVKKLKQNDNITIVTFSDRAEVVLPAMGTEDLPRIEQKISLLNASGGTEIFQGLEAGFRQLQLLGGKADIFARHLFLFTDGHTYGDEASCFNLAKQAKEAGINVTIFGIGGEWNDTFLDQLAGIAGGNTFFVESQKALDLQIDQKISLLSSLYARNVTLQVEESSNAELRYAFRITPDTNPLPISETINLGNLYYDRHLSILLELLVPPIKTTGGKINLVRGRITGDLIFFKKKLDYPISLHRHISITSEPDTPPAELVEAMARLTLYRLQEKARREVMEGQVLKAVGHLQSLATHLMSNGQTEFAHAVMVEAEYVRKSHSFSKDGDKRIKYGTKALLLPSGLELNR